MVKKHCLYEDFSNPRPLLTQSSGTGDPGHYDHSEIRTHDLFIESRMKGTINVINNYYGRIISHDV